MKSTWPPTWPPDYSTVWPPEWPPKRGGINNISDTLQMHSSKRGNRGKLNPIMHEMAIARAHEKRSGTSHRKSSYVYNPPIPSGGYSQTTVDTYHLPPGYSQTKRGGGPQWDAWRNAAEGNAIPGATYVYNAPLQSQGGFIVDTPAYKDYYYNAGHRRGGGPQWDAWRNAAEGNAIPGATYVYNAPLQSQGGGIHEEISKYLSILSPIERRSFMKEMESMKKHMRKGGEYKYGKGVVCKAINEFGHTYQSNNGKCSYGTVPIRGGNNYEYNLSKEYIDKRKKENDNNPAYKASLNKPIAGLNETPSRGNIFRF